jgi:hypothetical protein
MVRAVLVGAPLVAVESNTPPQYLYELRKGFCVLTYYHVLHISKVEPVPNYLTCYYYFAYVSVSISLRVDYLLPRDILFFVCPVRKAVCLRFEIVVLFVIWFSNFVVGVLGLLGVAPVTLRLIRNILYGARV